MVRAQGERTRRTDPLNAFASGPKGRTGRCCLASCATGLPVDRRRHVLGRLGGSRHRRRSDTRLRRATLALAEKAIDGLIRSRWPGGKRLATLRKETFTVRSKLNAPWIWSFVDGFRAVALQWLPGNSRIVGGCWSTCQLEMVYKFEPFLAFGPPAEPAAKGDWKRCDPRRQRFRKVAATN